MLWSYHSNINVILPTMRNAEVKCTICIIVISVNIVTPHAQRERGKVIGVGVHIYVYMFVDEKNI